MADEPKPRKFIIEVKGVSSEWSTGLGLIILAIALALICLSSTKRADGTNGPSLRDAAVYYLMRSAPPADPPSVQAAPGGTR